MRGRRFNRVVGLEAASHASRRDELVLYTGVLSADQLQTSFAIRTCGHFDCAAICCDELDNRTKEPARRKNKLDCGRMVGNHHR
jgi:hypothetical protein